jgi:broad specificity phosphatase PhoE
MITVHSVAEHMGSAASSPESGYGDNLRVFLVRHGRSMANDQADLIGGRCLLSPLTPVGRQEAEEVGRALRDRGIVPQLVHTSPAVRALDTAFLALARMDCSNRVVVDERLHEQDVGEWAGCAASQVYDDEVLRRLQQQGKDFRPPGGESMNDVGRRMAAWLDDLPNGEGRPVVVLAFTHGGAIRALASRIHQWSHARTYETRPANASVSMVTRSGAVAKFGFVGLDAQAVS